MPSRANPRASAATSNEQRRVGRATDAETDPGANATETTAADLPNTVWATMFSGSRHGSPPPVQRAPAKAKTPRDELIDAFHEDVKASSFPTAAVRLSGFNDDDIIRMIRSIKHDRRVPLAKATPADGYGYARVERGMEKVDVQAYGESAADEFPFALKRKYWGRVFVSGKFLDVPDIEKATTALPTAEVYELHDESNTRKAEAGSAGRVAANIAKVAHGRAVDDWRKNRDVEMKKDTAIGVAFILKHFLPEAIEAALNEIASAPNGRYEVGRIAQSATFVSPSLWAMIDDYMALRFNIAKNYDASQKIQDPALSKLVPAGGMSPSQHRAMAMLDETASLPSAWKNIAWPAIRMETAARVFDPTLINQATTGTCGFAAAFYAEARRASSYVEEVINVFSTGRHGSFEVPAKVRTRKPLAGMARVDWLMLTAAQNRYNAARGDKEFLGDALVDKRSSPVGGTPDYAQFGATKSEDTPVSSVEVAVAKTRAAFADGPESVIASLSCRAKYLDRSITSNDVNHDVALTGPVFVDDMVNVPLYTWGTRRLLRLSEGDFLKFADTLHVGTRTR